MNRPFVCFLMLASILLTVDLASKSLAFARVAGEPVDLSATGGRAEAIPAHDPVIAVPKLLAFRLTLNRARSSVWVKVAWPCWRSSPPWPRLWCSPWGIDSHRRPSEGGCCWP